MVAGAVDEGLTGLPDFGPYRIQELLGQGGMGVVHRAYDTVHERVVALKRLPASVTDRDFRARFRRESRIVANLSHPNVVPVNDFGEIDEQLYLDMMLVDGIDLRRAMGAGAVDQERAVAILTQVAHALDAAHAGGLVHRDVKPSNVLIDRADHAYLADFGIARATSPEETALTRSGDLVGSWDYMAPERLSGGVVDGRSDQYSLACVLFECLTGRLPHPATDPAAKVAAHLLQPPPAPSVFDPTITPALDDVVMRGMAKDPERRFSSSTELMAAAESAVFSGNTVRAARQTLPGPVSKERDQGRVVRAILRSTAVRKPPTLRLPHDYPPTCPYPGLRGFERGDAELFHGRDHVVTDLLVRLAEQLDTGEPVVLVGASGAGKSSVLRAGLLPTLTPEEAQQPTWPQFILTPGPDPIGTLATALAPQVGATPAELARTIRERPAEFGARCARSPDGEPIRPVIVVDQFEELFTHGTADTDRMAFATALANAHPSLVLLAVRADLVERCIELSPLMPALTAPVLLGPMGSTELRQAIVQPAQDAGVEVEPGLPERLIADLGVRGELGYDPGALPRLAHALRETWNHGDGNTLTLAAYRRAGGIDGAVARTAEEIFAQLDQHGRQALRATMLRMVTVSGSDAAGTVSRRRVDPRELVAIAGHSGVLDRLIGARLVTVDATGARLAHEALLTAWPRLRDWIEEDRAGLIQHRRFTEAVQAWAESGGHDDDLYRGVRLATLTSWLESSRDRVRLHPAEQNFLARSNAAEQAGQLAARRRTRRLRTLVAALSLLLVVASVAVFVATELQQDAQDERAGADAARQLSLSRQLAAESAVSRGIDPRRTALSALGAWQAGPTVEARSALLANQTDHYRGVMGEHEGVISSIAVSEDGKTAVSGGRDGTLRLWDVPNRRELAVLDKVDGGWFRTVSMSSDGRLLAAANVLSQNVTLWNVPERKRLFTVPDGAIDAAVSLDGRTVAAHLSNRNSVAVWDTTTFAEVARFPAEGVLAMAYSPDGTLVALADADKVLVRRVPDGALVATLTGHTDEVTSVAFAPTGPTLASASTDGSVRLWDTAQWTLRHELSTSEGPLSVVTFSPTGSTVVATGVGSTVYAWDVAGGAQLLALATGSIAKFGLGMSGDGHTLLSGDANGVITVWSVQRVILGPRDSSVTGVAFQPDGDLLASVTGTGIVELWDGQTGDLVRRFSGHTDTASDVTFSPDGAQFVTVGSDGAVIVWDVESGAELRRFSRPGTEFTSAEFSPDGATIAVSGRSPTSGEDDRDEMLLLRANDLTVTDRRPTRQEPRNDEGPNDVDTNHPTNLAFSPDGRLLAVTLSAGKVGLWNLVDRGAEMTILPGHDGIALDAEFSPDGETLVTSGADRLVKLWRVRDGQQIGEVAGHDSIVREVALSPDGATLVTASGDTVVRVWDMRTGQPIARLDRHDDVLNDVAFDPKGGRVASAGADGTTRLWDLEPEHAIRQICDLLDPETLADEWRSVGPDRGDPPSCPR